MLETLIPPADISLGVDIKEALEKGLIAKRIDGMIKDQFHGIPREDLKRFYHILRDSSRSRPLRDALRSIINAHVNAKSALDPVETPRRKRELESCVKFDIEECRLALRKLGIEW